MEKEIKPNSNDEVAQETDSRIHQRVFLVSLTDLNTENNDIPNFVFHKRGQSIARSLDQNSQIAESQVVNFSEDFHKEDDQWKCSRAGYPYLKYKTVSLFPLIEISKDHMLAEGIFKSVAKKDQAPSWEDFNAEIEHLEINAELDQSVYNKAVEAKESKFTIAKGIPPKPAIPAQMEFTAYPQEEDEENEPNDSSLEDESEDAEEIETDPPDTTDDADEKPNYIRRKRLRFHSVKSGEVLAITIPPVEGKPGLDIFNEIVPPPVVSEQKIYTPGDNTRLVEDLLIESTSEGIVTLVDDTIQVAKTLVLRRDVDMSMENINIYGNIKISGCIRSGMRVEASGSIDVGKHIEDCVVISNESVTVGKGIFHTKNGYLQAKEDVICNHAENATIEAGRDIHIHSEAMYCQLSAGRHIHIKKKAGVLIGGTLKAGKSIQTNTIGSEACKSTELYLGFCYTKLSLLLNEGKKYETWLEDTNKLLDEIQAEESAFNLRKEGKRMINELIEHRSLLCQKLLKLYTEIDDIPHIANDDEEPPFCHALIRCFRRTSVWIDDINYKVENNLGSAAFKLDSETQQISIQAI